MRPSESNNFILLSNIDELLFLDQPKHLSKKTHRHLKNVNEPRTLEP